MKNLLTAVTDRLEEAAGDLAWIDFDHTQIDFSGNETQVQFPCVLSGIDLNRCEGVKEGVQQCTASVIVRVAFDKRNLSGVSTATEARERSLPDYDLLEKVYLALEGYEPEGFGLLERVSQVKEKRTDGLFVYVITFNSVYMDLSASF